MSVTDGPFAETKEQLGGFGVIEAIDLNDAIQLMSKHPSLKLGVVEIRPADNLTGMIRESERRRAATIADDGRENREGTSPIVGINAASLDDPSWFRPQCQIFSADAQPRDYMDPTAPKFEKYKTE